MQNAKRSFYPDYLSEILLVIFLTAGTAFVLALLFPPPLTMEINFAAAYQPLPEWYFLWIYQLVKYFPGAWAFVGTVLVPAAAFALLLFIPRIDRGTASTRVLAGSCIIALLISFIILTLVAL
ncbi:MAG: hypothetical protein AB1553_14835 [Nitrospirota bacterium]